MNMSQEKKTTFQTEKNKEIKNKYHYTTDWFEQHQTEWKKNSVMWKDTLSHLQGKKINFLEIGVFEGRSTIWLLENFFENPESKLVAVDLFEECLPNYKHEKLFRENIEKSGKANQVEIIKGKSFDVLAKLNCEKREPFDFIYIDDCHDSLNVMEDAVLGWNLLKEGRIMIFDDYEWDNMKEEFNNPRLAIDAFLKTHQIQIELVYKSYQVAIKKVIREIPRTERTDRRVKWNFL